jgi:cellulase (glycosyl hydrolase family 5)
MATARYVRLRRGERLRRPRSRTTTTATAVVIGLAVAAGTATAAGGTVAAAATPATQRFDEQWFDTPASATLTVTANGFVDGYGRQVVLRGFNVSGEAKLAENAGLPFADVADARASAAAMRQQTGANAIRFLLTWAYIEPQPNQIDYTYLANVTAQMQPFLEDGIDVLVDFHQDLFSRYLFNSGSWYTGDGAPKWVIDAGGYPKESCGICINWGQNITQNAAVQDATYDFWHNRVLTTAAGQIAEQDAYLAQAEAALTYLRAHLSADEFTRILGADPYNEPYAGKYDSGQSSQTWERDLLWPFFQKFRAGMDAAGWSAKPAFTEPNLFWNANLSFEQQPGGLANVGAIGARYVFNTHFYDEAALSGIFMIGKAGDGQYTVNFDAVRQRGADLGTSALVSEFGSPQSGYTSDKTPTVLKAMYQALDSGVSGANWWSHAAQSGGVLSGTEWQWDLYSGRHHELMNGNGGKVQSGGDAWNGEDFSVIDTDSSGAVQLRQDARVLDRLYPLAVAGRTLAFTYEDRSRDGSTTLTWNPVPASLPNTAALVGSGQYGVLVWRSTGSAGSTASTAPTELHLPAAFTPAGTTVLSDLGTVTGLPAYAANGQSTSTPIAYAPLPGASGADRLLLSDSSPAGTLHFALITNGSTSTAPAQRAAAQAELAAWATAAGFPPGS